MNANQQESPGFSRGEDVKLLVSGLWTGLYR